MCVCVCVCVCVEAFIRFTFMRIQFTHTFADISNVENLLASWKEFVSDKRRKSDVEEFSLRLMGNIFDLNTDLTHHTYRHGPYQAFEIHDPKPRSIHKALVRDRLLHHAIYRVLYPFFDRTFIADSYSCRIGKGTHKAFYRFREFAYVVSKNNTRTCWVLKCDVRKFFASVDQEALRRILRIYIPDSDILWLLDQVISSFHSTGPGKGLPLGNLTSQLLVNIYMNEFDQYVKHRLKAQHYIRYADDFVILSRDRGWLEKLIPKISAFLWDTLRLELHPHKVSIGTLASGVDFLGWVHFPDHRVLRTATKQRMMRNLEGNESENRLNSYLGLLRHGNTEKLRAEVLERFPINETP